MPSQYLDEVVVGGQRKILRGATRLQMEFQFGTFGRHPPAPEEALFRFARKVKKDCLIFCVGLFFFCQQAKTAILSECVRLWTHVFMCLCGGRVRLRGMSFYFFTLLYVLEF